MIYKGRGCGHLNDRALPLKGAMSSWPPTFAETTVAAAVTLSHPKCCHDGHVSMQAFKSVNPGQHHSKVSTASLEGFQSPWLAEPSPVLLNSAAHLNTVFTGVPGMAWQGPGGPAGCPALPGMSHPTWPCGIPRYRTALTASANIPAQTTTCRHLWDYTCTCNQVAGSESCQGTRQTP